MPIVGNVHAVLASPQAGVSEHKILLDQSGKAEQEARHRVASAGVARQIRVGSTEIESAVALVGLVLGDLAAAIVFAELQRVPAERISDVIHKLVGVFET